MSATVTIQRLAQGGYGVGNIDGKTVFVPWVIPGEVVEIDIISEKDRYAFGLPKKIVSPSSERVAPPCPYYGECGGCQFQHMAYATQLYWKREIVADTLKKIAHVENPPVQSVLPSSREYHYRNRIQLQVGPKGEIGFFQADGRKLIAIDRCLIAEERINTALGALDKRKARQKGNRFELIVGEDGEVRFEVEKGPFSQVNPEQNEVLIREVLACAAPTKTETVVELFCGNGNFTLPLARTAGRVIAIEQNPLSVREARQKADRAGLTNIQFRVSQVATAVKGMRAERSVCDVAFLDPPRKGAREILGDLAGMKPRRIVYVSCFPPTLARDVGYLTRQGYRLEKVQPIDMFPQTHHVESVSLLKRSDA